VARVLIGFGTNLGDREDSIRRMLEELERRGEVRVVRCSRLYETEPVGGPPQGAYLNGVVVAETALEPGALLAHLQEAEAALDRRREVRWGPRTMDLDILLYGDRVVSAPELEIPHPRMRERLFVLVPAAEAAGDWVDPVTGRTVAELCAARQAEEGEAAAARAVRLYR
jgi:2-amino-4-hydroxy-6-hydroxymethyldihydropteridine diphosphokinase